MKCINNCWKYENNIEITHSIIHYLFSIDFLLKTSWYARWVDIAKNLSITPWSCSTALKNLIKKWFIYEDTNKFIFLTKLWEEIVEKANYKRNILLNFFKNTLSLNDNISNINACNIEHLLSDEVIEAIKKISN